MFITMKKHRSIRAMLKTVKQNLAKTKKVEVATIPVKIVEPVHAEMVRANKELFDKSIEFLDL